MNSVILKGNVATDIKYIITDKTTVAEFNMAVSRPFAKEKTDFFRIVAFGVKADFVNKWFKKGQPILISGYIVNDGYIDKDGNNRTITKVTINEVDFAGYPKNVSFQQSAENNSSEYIKL